MDSVFVNATCTVSDQCMHTFRCCTQISVLVLLMNVTAHSICTKRSSNAACASQCDVQVYHYHGILPCYLTVTRTCRCDHKGLVDQQHLFRRPTMLWTAQPLKLDAQLGACVLWAYQKQALAGASSHTPYPHKPHVLGAVWHAGCNSL